MPSFAARSGTVGTLLLLSATASHAQEQNELERCDRPIGTIAMSEPRTEYMQYFARYSLGSPTALIRMMVQQSNCFTVLERGQGLMVAQGERELARSGEGQSGSNMGGGQMVLADFVLNPAIQVVDNNAGGVGAAVAGVGRRFGRLGALAGGLKFKEATTTILIADARTTVQVAAAEGKAKKTDFSLGMFGWGGGIAAGAGAYTSTAEGKMIAASYLDNYSTIVRQLKADPTMMARASRFDASRLTSGDAPAAGPVYADGDVVRPKIDNVRVYDAPRATARVAGTVAQTSDLVVMGAEEGGFLKVMGSTVEGWVQKTLVTKR